MRYINGFTVYVVAITLALFAVRADAITLREAIQLALENNPAVKASISQKSAVESMADQAKSGYLPSVEISETASSTNNPMYAFGAKLNQASIVSQDFDPAKLNKPDQIDNFKSSMSVRQPLYTGGKLTAENKKAESAVQSADISIAQTKRDITFNVIQTWLGLQLLGKKAEVLGYSQKSALDNMKITQDRVDTGLALPSDLLDMKINYERVQKEINAVKADMETAQTALKTLLGVKDVTPQFVEYTAPANPGDLEELVKNGIGSRADVKKLAAEIDRANYNMQSAKSGFLPTVGVAADYDWNKKDMFGDGGDSWLVAMEAKWNIFAGGKDAAKLRESQATLDALNFGKSAMQDRARIEIEENYRKLKTAIDNLEISKRQVTLAEESHRIVKEQYKAGLKTATDLLNAETQLEQARLGESAAEHERLLSQARLDLSLGKDETSIKEKSR